MKAGSFYTIIGAGGDLSEWVNGYNDLLKEQGIGTPKQWYTFNGSHINSAYDLEGTVAYKSDLPFLAFPLDGLDVGKLAIFRLRMEDKWFDDIVANNAIRMGRDTDDPDEDE